jgi:hypothetical protein
VADQDFVNVGRGDPGPLERRPRGRRAELRRVHVPQRSAVAADGRTGSANDDDVGKGHNLSIVPELVRRSGRDGVDRDYCTGERLQS